MVGMATVLSLGLALRDAIRSEQTSADPLNNATRAEERAGLFRGERTCQRIVFQTTEPLLMAYAAQRTLAASGVNSGAIWRSLIERGLGSSLVLAPRPTCSQAALCLGKAIMRLEF